MEINIQQLLVQHFGATEGLRLYLKVLPSVMKDFEQTVQKALIGLNVTEEYHLDDHSAKLVLTGHRSRTGACELTDFRIL